ncbi:MAG: AraC family transcriptional regulator [Nevskia sp.]|nr:AraC family transcriptional regulator [Nevskia sp.]
MDWRFPRSSYSVGLMCSAAAEHGLSQEQCLAGSRIEAAALHDPAAEIYPEQELAVIGNIVRQLGHVPGIGLEMGSRIHMSVYGILAFALSSCATIRELMELGIRYSRLAFSLTDKRFEQHGDEFHVYFDDQHIPEPLRRFVLERDLAGIFNIQVELFSRHVPFRRMLLQLEQPAYADRFEKIFGLRPEFGAQRSVLIADAAVLDLPLPQANRHALRYWETQLQDLLTKKAARVGMAGKVRSILLRSPGEAPDMERIAAELCTTSRHLRRLLTTEGTSFRGLVDEIRETMAEELLCSARLTVEQVADRLGYNEVSSFTTAFRRWKGMPPRDWRSANLRQTAPPARLS